MRRDVLLLEEMIQAAVQAVALLEGVAVEHLAADRIRRDALPWNFTVLGEAAAQLSDELKQEFASVPWRQPVFAQPDCAWLLVHRLGRRPFYGAGAAAWLHR
jgi:uncharacterized protein with HEPN domain